MKAKVSKKGKDLIRVEIHGARHTLPNMLREVLWEDKTVSLAAYEKSHPYLGNPILVVKADDPQKALFGAVKRTKQMFSEFKEQFEKLC